jgi:FG-GAP repeat
MAGWRPASWALAGTAIGVVVGLMTVVAQGAPSGPGAAGQDWRGAGTTPFVAGPLTLTSPNAQSGSVFGYAVAISGGRTVVGAPGEDSGGVSTAGNVYVLSTTTGHLALTLTSPNPVVGGNFGTSVAISGSRIAVGAPYETAAGALGAGHAYVFSAKTGALITTLTSANPEHNGAFGCSVAISGSKVVVGAEKETVTGLVWAGRAYVFNAATGGLLTTLTSANPQTEGIFGVSVAASGSKVAVGAAYETVSGLSSAGHAYVFKATTGKLVATLASPNPETGGEFGAAIALQGKKLVVGAPDETVAGAMAAGRAYAFQATKGTLLDTLASPNPEAGGSFGWSVALVGGHVLVGAPFETAAGQTQAGNAYTFSLATGTLVSTLSSPNAQAGGNFGYSVAISGKRVLIGAQDETVGAFSEAGHAYRF